jgi:hypothetical protein
MAILAAAISLFTAPSQVIDIARLTEAIRQAENTPLHYISPSGCRGEYQLSVLAWKQNSNQPFLLALTDTPEARATTKRVAESHVSWIVNKALPALKLPVTPYSAALIWRKGYGNVAKLNLTAENVDFARRVQNLYEAAAP